MTFSIQGFGVANGIAIGKVHILQRGEVDIAERAIPTRGIDAEVRRYENALAQAHKELKNIRDQIPAGTPADISAFIDTHMLMLKDYTFAQVPTRLIREQRCNAEWALKLQRDAVVRVFDEMDDAYLRTRRDDVNHVVSRIHRILLNQQTPKHESPSSQLQDYIILADDLAPSDTVLMKHHGINAFATEFGGPTSHTAILARSMGIPAIVGLKQASRYIRDGETVIVDSRRGVVLVDPDDRILRHYRGLQRAEKRHQTELNKLREEPAVTLDDIHITLHANIELPEDIRVARRAGATGVGLYRTEYMYMNRDAPPSENEQLHDFRRVVRSMKGLPLTIRTLDLGADKQVNGDTKTRPLVINPALGLRAVRLCLQDPALFKPQLRAIMRASAYGPVRLLIPMLSSVQEMTQVTDLIDLTREQLKSEKLRFDPDMPVGAMIEVPAAAICADAFANQLDFLSIGTNDLIQYTLAIDRINESVSYLYDPLHPAVLRLIGMVLKAGHEAGVPVAMCGEMAGDSRLTRLLLGLGLREFSVHPSAILEVKRVIKDSHAGKLAGTVRRVIRDATGAAISQSIDRMNKTI